MLSSFIYLLKLGLIAAGRLVKFQSTMTGKDGGIFEIKLNVIMYISACRRVFAPDVWREGEQAESGGSGRQRAGGEDWSGGGTAERREQHQQVSQKDINLWHEP